MSRSSSVLNFREIIISGIQDLEQGVKQRNQDRSSSQKKASQHQIESPIPCFQSSYQDNSPSNIKDLDLSYSPKNVSQYEMSNKLEYGLKDYNKIQLQSFKIPSFTNPVQKNQKNRETEKQSYKLNLNNVPNQSGFDYQQKENSALAGGECTFREKNSTYYFKDVNTNKNIPQYNVSQYSIIRQSEKNEIKSNQVTSYQDRSNNEKQLAFKHNDMSNDIYSPLASRMEWENDSSIFQIKNSSKYESNKNFNKQIQENERNVDYFSIYDNPYQDRQNIFKTLKISEPQTIPTQISSNIESPKFDQVNQNKNVVKNKFKRAKSSYNLKESNSFSNNKNGQQQKQERIDRSLSFKKGINLSPPRKTTISSQMKTERIPTQISFEDSLRSYQMIDQNIKQPITQYAVQKENLKRMILNFESDQLRGIYNLSAFIKFFRELGLMQVAQQQENNLQQEIQVVEELWRLLKFASYSAECVNTSFIYQIVLIIIDCQTYKAIQASQLIDTLCQKEYQKYSNFFQQERENSSIWISSEIVNGIRDALSVSKKNEKIFVKNEIMNKNNQKAKIAQLFQHTNYLKTDGEQHKTKRSYSNNQLTNNSDEDFIYEVQKSNQNQFNKQQHNENSTDSLHSLKQSSQLNQKGDKSNRKSDRDQYKNQKNVHQRLFNNSQSKTRIIKDHLQAKEQKEQNEINQCTFKPQINKNTQKILQKSLSNLQLQKNKEPIEQEEQSIRETIKGVKQNLQRMEQARQQRNHEEKYWENQRLKYQNYLNRSPLTKNSKQQQKLVNLSPSPQKLRTEKIMREKPMLYVDINITKGKTGKIAIYQGDIPEDVANNFAKIYKLNTVATQKLTNKLKDIIQAYYSQLYDQF
ncbi:hypothetical protein TTHERM_00140930 (macronuclear) [Tetrahymena thermophila SB210]|uniref:Uncharacterized protein n=1 Tax=Tetrahymena thermophila (strain SB210) TaxID=312017 RepID=I7LU82_TETTS|nr:hypothetical protein TTHERM_00140930 [Tetrahymena thermophila SB210]EAR90785.1 hypothetical protein TTHERM_00140930 [Tetrahymena thermophila SB210]|eukprot:XP_001011030.1 hypothetical protein TTHERM_00140930 [Tetrahymena thermophila SB210]